MSSNHSEKQRPFSRPTKRSCSDQSLYPSSSTELPLDSRQPGPECKRDCSRWTLWRHAKHCSDNAVLDTVLEVLASDERPSTSEAKSSKVEEQSSTPLYENASAMCTFDANDVVHDITEAAVGFTADLTVGSSLERNDHEQEDDFDVMEADNFANFQENYHAADSSPLNSNDQEDFDEIEADSFPDFQENDALDKDGDAQEFLSQEGDQPLYLGSKISVIESVVSILVFYLTHSLTLASLSDLLTLINLHCPTPNFCKKTIYLFKKFLAFQQPVQTTYYCNSCYTLHSSSFSICPDCKCQQRKDCNFITQMSASQQLKVILERPGVLQNVSKSKCDHGSEMICDLYDGTVYRAFKEQYGNGTNVTFTWFTDGAALFKSSNVSLWPLYLAINELPFTERLKPENLILVALWVGEKKPEMNIFFKCCESFLTEVEKGTQIVVDGSSYTIKGKILCGACDLPAKCSVLNMMQFNGAYGCAKCLQKGETFFYEGQGNKIRRSRVHVYPFRDTIDEPKRSHEDTISHAKEAYETKSTVYGVKGPSQLCLYVPDIIKSTGIDYMHGVCLGTMKKVLSLFLDPSYSKCDFSISKFRTAVDKNIHSISVPHMLQRAPRSVNLLKQWKASELKNFLLYYSIPVLSPVLKKKYLEHLMLLVFAMSIMLQKSISKTELLFAEQALWQYVFLFEKLYGRQHMSANVHNLLHLGDCVRDLGPLWASSCFGWESVNGSLLKYVHGTQYVQMQINAAISIQLSLPLWIEKIKNPKIKLFCKNMQKSNRYRANDVLDENTYVVGSMHDSTELETNQLMLLLGDTFKNCKVFHRMIIRKMLFTSYSYSKTHKKKSCYVKCRDNSGALLFGHIDYFTKLTVCSCETFNNVHCSCAPKYYCVIQKYNCKQPVCTTDLEKNVSLSHVSEVVSSSEYALILYEQLLLSCISYKCSESEKMYFSEVVNLIEVE